MASCRFIGWSLHEGILWCAVLVSTVLSGAMGMAEDVVPHHQDRPPGAALSPAEAMAKMTLPPGFSVELVASEPDIVNPVAMTFDDRGRVWITESLEYPRRPAGPGRDRVKVLEDTDGDGRADRFTIFADGLNIPSGIAVGYGGVWVANAPDILFLQDTNGDGKADKREVVVTGFGRQDTHELPNSLTWGPDGFLYGLNGVNNPSRVEQNGHMFDFTCALFRIHPRTRKFELFAEGTSNPWGLAWNDEGSAFVSACVIDHLWHITQSAYYVRQGGALPPFTYPRGSIVQHKHQKAAYCGLTYFDSDAYPQAYRGRLYMGNLHGGCINVDVLKRDGSTYFADAAPDFLTANDAWFMPVVQKTGPDGCLYILDWYDRYHCYQDANRDPKGIDRAKGRLYRVRYQQSPRAAKFDLAKESDELLIARLGSPNIFFRETAERILSERNHADARSKLEKLVLDEAAPRKSRTHALWALVGSGPLEPAFHRALLEHTDSILRAWAVRSAANARKVDLGIMQAVTALAGDPSPDVRVQVAIAARRIEGIDSLAVLTKIAGTSYGDKLLPHIVWQNLHPLLEDNAGRFIELAEKVDLARAPGLAALLPRVIERLLGRRQFDLAPVAAVLRLATSYQAKEPADVSRASLAVLADKVVTREISAEQVRLLRGAMDSVLREVVGNPQSPAYFEAVILEAAWNDSAAVAAVRAICLEGEKPVAERRRALEALVAARDPRLEAIVRTILIDSPVAPLELRSAVLGILGREDAPWVATCVLAVYPKLDPVLRPQAINLLTQRAAWASALVDAIARNELPSDVLGANQLRKLQSGSDTALAERVRARWGAVRTERNPDRERVVAEVRALVRRTPGNPLAGREVFRRVCGQCHKLHGEGQEVGPDLTSNGRNSYEQLLSNVLDPSLVIGPAYQARTVVTKDGRVLSGVPTEDGAQRVVLKILGGKLEVIPRGEIEQINVSKLSLMPEDLEKQLKPGELADLFSFLTLDKPPEDPTARRLPGVYEDLPQPSIEPTPR